jgi:hypothetical protein
VSAYISGTRIAIVVITNINFKKVITMRAKKNNLQETIIIETAAWSCVLAIVYLLAAAIL